MVSKDMLTPKLDFLLIFQPRQSLDCKKTVYLHKLFIILASYISCSLSLPSPNLLGHQGYLFLLKVLAVFL